MFISYEEEVKSLLLIGENTLEVQFTSPINKNRDRVNNYPYKLPSGSETTALQVDLSPERLHIILVGLGPRFVTMGIWKLYI